uniref:sodium-coupled monocarboxylate transporter 1-like n=1 Tax=Styela clava TaxID=7725 RepID=UPI0019399126|nr:sodium-coupled monocarboxylate transporter 1-like [Styela clava]
MEMKSSTESVISQMPNGSKYFHPVDYVVFSIMLMLSASIGVYFAVQARRTKATSSGDYLMASRKMTHGPVSFSLLASFMSSVTILGLPAEYYMFGTMFTWFGLIYLLQPLIITSIYLPVFYELELVSAYEYLELRYNRLTRLLVTVLYLVLSTLYGGIVTYGPALALSKVTGLNMWGSIICTGGVCMFYTTLGGLKAVIWTDVLQSIIMISGFLVVIIQGSINLGGFSNIWKEAVNGGRIDFVHFEIDPRIRHTFWTILIGGSVLNASVNGCNQSQIQRYVCCRTKRDASISIFTSAIGLIIIMILAGMTGLTIYAIYKECDPISSGEVDKADQLFPYVIMDIVGHLPGIPGLFVAAVFSSSLSTISSGINAMACVTLEDFVRPSTNWTEMNYTRISKVFVILYGVLYIFVAFLASQIGGLIQMSFTVHGTIGGPITGIFTIGMLASWVNSWGALSGIFAGLFSTMWLFVGSRFYPSPPKYTRPLNLYTDGCIEQDLFSTASVTNVNTSYEGMGETSADYDTSTTNYNLVTELSNDRPPIAEFYALSYLHFATVGFLTAVSVAMIVSLLTGRTKKRPPGDELLVPFMRSGEIPKKENLEKTSRVEGAERSMSWVSPDKLLIHKQEETENAPKGTTTFSKNPNMKDNNADEQMVLLKENSLSDASEEVFESESRV